MNCLPLCLYYFDNLCFFLQKEVKATFVKAWKYNGFRFLIHTKKAIANSIVKWLLAVCVKL